MSYLIHLFEQHSYLILFLGIFLELMALPISGEFLMSYAGYFVYLGKMNYILALLTVLLSGGAGITVTYWIGKVGGFKLIEKYGKYIYLGPERYKNVSSWFEHSGNKLLVFAYFIPGIRHFTGYVSGISRIPFRKFIIPAYTGAFLWGVCFITLGKVFGPEWKIFHEAASKYFVILIIIMLVVLAGFLLYRFFKIQIESFFTNLLKRLMDHLKTIRATELFLIFLTVVLIGMVSFMLGLAQDYLEDEFSKFNELAEYMVLSVVYTNWMKGFVVFQSPMAWGSIIAITIIGIWSRGQNRLLEYLLLGVSIVGAKPFHHLISKTFTYLQSLGFFGKFHSTNFPDMNAFALFIIYGTSFFLLVRHSKKSYIPITTSLLVLVLFAGIAVVNIALSSKLPSDIVGGYVYGGVWIFFNFLLFEMIRLVLEKYKEGMGEN